MRWGWWIATLAVAAGCLSPQATVCPGGGVCPPGLACKQVDGADVCVLPTCGNGARDPGETCDDGNHIDGDGCPFDCLDLCGNGVADEGEVCDDGNRIGGDGCSADCASDETCGNGIVDLSGGAAEVCDDGNDTDQDGCSRSCAAEVGEWRLTTDSPSERIGAATAFDAARGRLVMFGGCGRRSSQCSGGFLNDTWEWDGVRWRERRPATVPPARVGASMTYDAARKVVVMVNGCNNLAGAHCSGSGGIGDIWEWNGEDWTAKPLAPINVDVTVVYDAAAKLTHAFSLVGSSPRFTWDGTTWTSAGNGGPSDRIHYAMAYDAKREVTVLFGGADGFDGSPLDETLEFHRTTGWTEKMVNTKPSARRDHQMVFDAKRGAVVLTGGCADALPPPTLGDIWTCATPASDGWQWDGQAWTPIDDMGWAPSGRHSHVLAYDTVRLRTVLFGGDSGAGFLTDTWELPHVDVWDPRIGAFVGSPTPSRPFSQIAYDSRRAKIIILQDNSFTWEWDGRWNMRSSPNIPPSPRNAGALAYDPVRDKVVLFGGQPVGATTPVADTWELDADGWTEKTPTTIPPARAGHAMTYDPVRQRVVMYGSGDGDLWEWDGVNWVDRTLRPAPTTLNSAALTYDVARGRLVLTGGYGMGMPMPGEPLQHWELGDAGWEHIQLPIMPPNGLDLGSVYDSLAKRIVIWGGNTGSINADLLWEYDGQRWTKVSPMVRPPTAGGKPMVYDAARRRIVLFRQFTDEIWLFDRTSSSAVENCAAGVDADGDGNVGCADTDCGASCDPLCTVHHICTSTFPRCGDASCNRDETCHSCPVDCGACPTVCGDYVCGAGETGCYADCVP